MPKEENKHNTTLLLEPKDIYEAISLLLEKRNLTRPGGYNASLRVTANIDYQKDPLGWIKNWEFVLNPS